MKIRISLCLIKLVQGWQLYNNIFCLLITSNNGQDRFRALNIQTVVSTGLYPTTFMTNFVIEVMANKDGAVQLTNPHTSRTPIKQTSLSTAFYYFRQEVPY